jgi:hypothetical protein
MLVAIFAISSNLGAKVGIFNENQYDSIDKMLKSINNDAAMVLN